MLKAERSTRKLGSCSVFCWFRKNIKTGALLPYPISELFRDSWTVKPGLMPAIILLNYRVHGTILKQRAIIRYT